MSNFGKSKAANDGYVRKLYTGVENFKIEIINPTLDELKIMYGDNARADEYVSESELKDGSGNTIGKAPQIKIVLHLNNDAEEGEESIKTRATYYFTKTPYKTRDGNKTQFINLYGQTMWLTNEQIAQSLPLYTQTGANGTYEFDATGMRPAYRNEDNFISLVRNLLNLPSLKNLEDKSTSASQLSASDWEAIFRGDVSTLNSIFNSTNNKVGFLLGVKSAEDKKYQDVFNKSTLRQYSKASGKFDYLRKQVQDAQSAGAYPNTDFGDPSYKLSEALEDAKPSTQQATKPAASFQAFQSLDEETQNAFTPSGNPS